MDGPEFVRRAKRYAKKNGLACRFEGAGGKGSHGRLYIGKVFTTVKRGEISPGLLAKMLSQLDIEKEEF
jgi:mRNA interferase HicA